MINDKKNDNDYLIHYGVLGMKWGRRKDKIASKKQRQADAAKEHLVKSAKAYSKTEQSLSRVYNNQASRMKQEGVNKYIKRVVGEDVSTKAAKKAYKDFYGISPKDNYKQDLDRLYKNSKTSKINSERYSELAKKYSDMNVQGLSKKEVRKQGIQIMKDMGISPAGYRLKVK